MSDKKIPGDEEQLDLQDDPPKVAIFPTALNDSDPAGDETANNDSTTNGTAAPNGLSADDIPVDRPGSPDDLGLTEDLDDINFDLPLTGTPADEAMAANRDHKVSKFSKHVGRKLHKMKRPKRIMKGTIKKKKRKNRSNIKGKVIDGKHEQYLLTIGMMYGIRVAVGRNDVRLHDSSKLGSNATVDVIRRSDFKTVEKYAFPPRGSETTPPHKLAHTFKFKDYSPTVFKAIRNMYNIDNANYMLSICGNFNFIQFMANSRSGQFFFYSHDGKYMIKTQTREENKFLRRILPDYYRYLREKPNTFITRFYGLHRVKMYHLRRKLRFVVMASVFDTPEKIHTMYDLKGSTVGRKASEEDRKTGGVLKDLDLISDKRVLRFNKHVTEIFLDQIKHDAKFLANQKIMDYSLLVGAHDRSRRASDFIEHEETRRASEEIRRISKLSLDEPILEERPTSDESEEQLPLSPTSEERPNSEDRPKSPRAHRRTSKRSDTPLVRQSLAKEGLSDTTLQQIGAEDPMLLKFRSNSVDSAEFTDEDDSDMSDSSDDDDDGGKKKGITLGGGARIAEDDDEIIDSAPPLLRMFSMSHRRDFGINEMDSNGNRANCIYFFGIIDILQEYNGMKKAETFFKGFTANSDQISCVNPVKYAKRFVNFIEAHTDLTSRSGVTVTSGKGAEAAI